MASESSLASDSSPAPPSAPPGAPPAEGLSWALGPGIAAALAGFSCSGRAAATFAPLCWTGRGEIPVCFQKMEN